MVGDLLCFNRPQTLVQVRDVYQRHYGIYSHCEYTFDQYLAHSLLRLAEHSLTRIEPGVPVALDNPALLTFAEIVTACQEYIVEHSEDYRSWSLAEVDIAVALLRLLDWGMVRLVVA